MIRTELLVSTLWGERALGLICAHGGTEKEEPRAVPGLGRASEVAEAAADFLSPEPDGVVRAPSYKARQASKVGILVEG